MTVPERLLIVGASARAAAASALRAGLRPWCLDLFADRDLQQLAPVQPIPPGGYPHALEELLPQGPPGPWMYTGALENHPALIERLVHDRPLWGTTGEALRVRHPEALATVLRRAGLPSPEVRTSPGPGQCWLCKPRGSAGGVGIREATRRDADGGSRRWYFQRFIAGEPRAAIYVGDGQTAQLLGVTRQLVGETWLGAAPFHYCGSIGSLPLSNDQQTALERLGAVLAGEYQLRGLFGVDGVWDGREFWPVEVNPRYTASVEVLELALGVPVLALHRRAFDPDAPAITGPGPTPGVVGKAVLFAWQALTVPGDGPWITVLRNPPGSWELPAFADVPPAGQRIEAGRPVLSLFARAASVGECEVELRRIAQTVEACLY